MTSKTFSLDDMELEVDIEKIFPTMEQPEIVTQQIVFIGSLLQMRFLVKMNPSLFKVIFLIRGV
jgi:hypothetical protein